MKVHSKELLLPFPYAVPTDGQKVERSTGLHLSEIIRRAAYKLRLLTPDDDQTEEEFFDFSQVKRIPQLRMHLGIAWENYISQLLPQKPGHTLMFHPGELYLSDIAMSPDAIEFGPDGQVIIHEFKCTWKSSRGIIDKQWMWLTQIKGYLKAVGGNHARLHVFYVRGDYAASWPEATTWELEFSDRELDDNWEMLLREARGLIHVGNDSNADTGVRGISAID